MGEHRVRTACFGDASSVADIHQRSWEVGYRGIVPDPLLRAVSLVQREERWRQILADDGGVLETLVAASDDGAICGFVSFGLRMPFGDETEHIGGKATGPDVGSVVALYVDPEHWRRGVGRSLLKEALRRMFRGGCREATIWVLKQNDGALAFYRGAGFRADGVEALHMPTGQSEMRLWLDLE
jgi:ribosomal protein S18 acetylase RimI-like enzyme